MFVPTHVHTGNMFVHSYEAAGGNFHAASTKLTLKDNTAFVTVTLEDCTKLKETFNKLHFMKKPSNLYNLLPWTIHRTCNTSRCITQALLVFMNNYRGAMGGRSAANRKPLSRGTVPSRCILILTTPCTPSVACTGRGLSV
jgi:hypothetical protein